MKLDDQVDVVALLRELRLKAEAEGGRLPDCPACGPTRFACPHALQMLDEDEAARKPKHDPPPPPPTWAQQVASVWPNAAFQGGIKLPCRHSMVVGSGIFSTSNT